MNELNLSIRQFTEAEPGVGDVGFQGGGLGGFLCMYDSVVDSVLELGQAQQQVQSSRVVTDVGDQQVVAVFTALLRPAVRVVS